MLLLLAQVATAQSLVNGDFETGAADPWSHWAPDIATIENLPDVAHGGDYVANVVIVTNDGTARQGGLWQDVSGIAGGQYVRGAAWVRAGDFAPLIGDTYVQLVHEHFDSGGIDQLRPEDLTTDLPQGEWHCLEVSAQAPVDTTFVRTAVLISSDADGTGGIWVDDVVFEVSDTPFGDFLCPQEPTDTGEPDDGLDGGGGQGNDDDDGDEAGSCGCSTGRAPVGIFALVIPLLWLRRRS